MATHHAPKNVSSKQSSDIESNRSETDLKNVKNEVSDLTPPTPAALAAKEGGRMEAVLGDALLRFLRIRKGPRKEQYDPDAIATQPSIWDSENVEEYKQRYIHPQWENWSAFDPSARWTWAEERKVRHKVDLKIMVSGISRFINVGLTSIRSGCA
jgi:hypothetical protein